MKYLACLLLLISIQVITSEHCGRTVLAYMTQNTKYRCEDLGGTYRPIGSYYRKRTYPGICKITVCGDGKPVEKGHFWCSVRSCNIFGYNCDGGCIPGDPVTSFKKLWPEAQQVDIL